MAEVKKREQTRAEQIIEERIAAATQEPISWPWPDRVAFVAADTEHATRAMLRYAREEKTLVVVYPDGEELILTPEPPAPPQ